MRRVDGHLRGKLHKHELGSGLEWFLKKLFEILLFANQALLEASASEEKSPAVLNMSIEIFVTLPRLTVCPPSSQNISNIFSKAFKPCFCFIKLNEPSRSTSRMKCHASHMMQIPIGCKFPSTAHNCQHNINFSIRARKLKIIFRKFWIFASGWKCVHRRTLACFRIVD